MDTDGPTQRRLHTQIRTQQQRLQQDAAAETGKVVADAKAGADGTAGITNTASAQTLAARRTGAKLDGTLKQKQAELAAQRQAAKPAVKGPSQTATGTTRRPAPTAQRPAASLAQTTGHSAQLTRDVTAEVAGLLGIPADRLTPKMQQTIALATGPLRALTGIGQAGSGQANPLQQALDLDPQAIETVRNIADTLRINSRTSPQTSESHPRDQGAGPEGQKDEAKATPVAGKEEPTSRRTGPRDDRPAAGSRNPSAEQRTRDEALGILRRTYLGGRGKHRQANARILSVIDEKFQTREERRDAVKKQIFKEYDRDTPFRRKLLAAAEALVTAPNGSQKRVFMEIAVGKTVKEIVKTIQRRRGEALGDTEHKIEKVNNGTKIIFDVATRARPLTSVPRDEDGNYLVNGKVYAPETMKGLMMSLRTTPKTLKQVLRRIPKLALKHPHQKAWLGKVAREMAKMHGKKITPIDNRFLTNAIEKRISDTAGEFQREKDVAFGAALLGSFARRRLPASPYRFQWPNWRMKMFLIANGLKDVRAINSRDANQDMINRMMAASRKAGNNDARAKYKPPIWEGADTFDATVGKSGLKLARIHAWFRHRETGILKTNRFGRWLGVKGKMSTETAERVREIFALPRTPTSWSNVKLPEGTRVRVSIVKPQDGWGKGGEIQIYVLSKVDKKWYSFVSWSFRKSLLP